MNLELDNMNLELDRNEVNLILQALAELPYKLSYTLINKVLESAKEKDPEGT